MHVTIVLPTYNEAENLPKLVSALFSLPFEPFLLVVDDHSPDGTGAIADELTTRHADRMSVLHRARKLGLRAAYRKGFPKALTQGAVWSCKWMQTFY